MDTVIQKAKEFIKDVFLKTDKAHDYTHALRVYENAVMLLKQFDNANCEVVLLCALLHDVDDKKLSTEGKMLDKWFLQYPSQYENEIRTVISEVSFSKNVSATTLEAQIVQDADRLDAIGAIGIARVFTYGGSIGRPIYSDTEPSSLSHFDEKLFKIKEKMNTDIGREIAAGRELYMKDFINQFWQEVGGKR